MMADALTTCNIRAIGFARSPEPGTQTSIVFEVTTTPMSTLIGKLWVHEFTGVAAAQVASHILCENR